ncbi:urease subunit beta [Halalkalibacter oceani]|uniref:urease subunit beta n=1 Tax=Halalkalibacter oceani TaxID=1653776 RepID=UPI0025597E2C|nr:urease subunit beta [Halalkalibacter oceani]
MNFEGLEVSSVIYKNEDITINEQSKRVKLKVIHCGDRPIQVGSHFHFFEANKALKFNREKAFGMHLDILSGTAVRFEPGDESIVTLVEYNGNKNIIGFNGLTMGNVEDETVKQEALRMASERGFLFLEEDEVN